MFTSAGHAGAPGERWDVDHRLEITLMPERHQLLGSDRIAFGRPFDGEIAARLSADARDLTVEAGDRQCDHRFNAGDLRIRCATAPSTPLQEVTIGYSIRYDDPVPSAPLNTDNPGFGVTGTISPAGTFLLAGSGWYPDIAAHRIRYRLRIRAPEGIVAVTAGRSEGIETRAGTTTSGWTVDRPVRGLALSAGPYQVRQARSASVRLATYFLPQSIHLADRYLDATATHLQRFEASFGPYPFSKFAVVENFFPTGYGFSSYTLLGTRVLQLPFIPDTSLAHEIAHCWWGNGVFVEPQSGNWSEGLTTYVADYLRHERISAAEAARYRLRMLRNFSMLVPPDGGFALSEFTHRFDLRSKAIGYDKSAMVFHMLRRYVGETVFWDTLKAISEQHRFTYFSWQDFDRIFAENSTKPLSDFFNQWISRKGAPMLSMDRIEARPQQGRWRIRGRIVQRRPFYHLEIPLELETDGPTRRAVVSASGRATAFAIDSDRMPRRLTLDPDHHLFRRLYPVEMPPTVNRLKASNAVLLVTPGPSTQPVAAVAAVLIDSLGLKDVQLVTETDLDRGKLENRDVLFFGLPRDPKWRADLFPQVAYDEEELRVAPIVSASPSETFWAVFRHPQDADRVAALFRWPDASRGLAVARKITHYGTYSYLVFRDRHNIQKGTWPVTASPLIHRWESTAAE